MIYFIKLIYSLLIPPGIFVLLLLLAALWMYYRVGRKSWLLPLALAFLLYLSSIPLIGEMTLQTLEDRYTPPATIEGDAYVVLTGGAIAGTPDIDGTGHLTGYTLHRIVSAAELYARHPLPILISGGQVFADTPNEGQLSKRKLIALGVPEQSILLDDQSRTTQENARNIKVLLEQQGLTRPVLITSAFHMSRSVKHFEEQQVEVIPYPVNYLVSKTDGGLTSRVFVPSSTAMNQLQMAMKEYLGMLQ